MNFSLTLPAPCKVNLTLDVFPPRAADGYHDIDSVVVPFTPADTITVAARPTNGTSLIHLTCNDSTLPTDDRNLAYRAAAAFLAAFNTSPMDITISLTKRLPHQAGLGGGSSDAAAVLKAFASAYQIAFTEERLLAAAASLGSDVPLFLYNRPVRMRGHGEIIEPLAFLVPQLFGVLVKPATGVPTGPAYAKLDALPNRLPGGSTPCLTEILSAGPPPDALGKALHNDFEAAVFPAYPEVAEAHRAVTDAGAVRALLCGSGSAVFGLARDRDHARVLVKALCGKFPWVHLAESVLR